MVKADDREDIGPVRAKAALIDPKSMTVQWMNESAAHDASAGTLPPSGTPLAEAIPTAELLGLPEALARVSETGVAEHLSTGLVSTARGSVTIVTSIYRLPDGQLLVITENAWQPERTGAKSTERRSGRRGR